MARRRGPSKYQRAARQPAKDVTELAHGGARRQMRGGGEWYVRDVPASRAAKSYACPGCGTEVVAGQAHLVVWSADHLFGDEAAVRDRRHWHGHCWRMA